MNRLQHLMILLLLADVFLSLSNAGSGASHWAGPKAAEPLVEVIEHTPNHVSLEFSLPTLRHEEVIIEGERFDKLSIPGAWTTGEVGHPALPLVSRFLAIPDRSDVEIEVHVVQEEELSGYRLQPVQPDSEPMVNYAPAIAARDDFGDTPWARIGSPVLIRDIRLAALTFHPVRFNPASGLIRVAERLRLDIRFDGVDLRNARQSSRNSTSPSFDALLRELVVNYEAAVGHRSIEPGSWVVVCPDDDDVIVRLQPLLDWRTRKGHPATLVTTTETGESADEIKAWLQQTYDTWDIPPEYVVLAGDTNLPYQIPTWFENLSGLEGEGDHPYVLLDGDDILVDAHVGRLSFNSLTELEVIVNKIVGYESTPELSDPDWYKRACLVGDPSDSGYSTIIVQQWIKDRLRDYHGYTEIDTIYDEPFVTQMRMALNKGDTIFSYRGFANMSGWQNSNTYALQNGWKMPFVVTITCDTGSFHGATARTEGFLRANDGVSNPRGGIGAIGTSTIGTHTRYNNCIHYGIFRGLLWEDQYELGAALSRGKLETYLNYNEADPNQVVCYSYWTNLIGDPAVDCWTGYPEPLTVQHPDTLSIGANAIIVSVSKEGLPERGVRVCLWKGSETYSVGLTDANGTIELPATLISEGEMLITVSKHNCHPYQAAIPVVSSPISVGYVSSLVDDDGVGGSIGNDDGIANPGETIELAVQVKNFGTQPALAVTATLSSLDPYVSIVDDSEIFGDLPGDSASWSTEDFDLTIDPGCPHGRTVRLGLDVTSESGSWHSLIDLPIVSAALLAEGVVVYDGGGNGLCDPGETVDLAVTLRNVGGLPAEAVTGTLVSQCSFTAVLDDAGAWNTIPLDGTAENSANLFSLRAAVDTPDGYLSTFALFTTFSNGITDTTVVTLPVGQRSRWDPVGPDTYGYYAFDDTDVGYPEAPHFEWIEIDPNYGGSGVEVPLTDFGEYEDDSVVIDLPFPFSYYGQVYTRATICSNGWIAMGSTWLTNYRNWTLPGAGGPDGIVCPFWDDLRIADGGGIYTYYDSEAHRFIVEYSRVVNEPGSTETLEAIFYDPDFTSTMTGDGIIEFQYQTVQNTDTEDAFATVGIESPDGTDGLLYSFYNQYSPGAAPLTSGRAIRFVPFKEGPAGTLAGFVRNASDGVTPLEGAEVALAGLGRVFVAGEDGGYEGTSPAGACTVVASHVGFAPESVEVVVNEGAVTELDFLLLDIAPPEISTTTHPSTSDTVGPYPVPVSIIDGTGLSEKILFYRTGGQSFEELALDGVAEDQYLSEIPGQDYVTRVEYYVYARDTGGLDSFDPVGAPENLHSFFVAPTFGLFVDDLEGDQGWVVGGPDDDATMGIWTRADPNGTFAGPAMVQPEDDHTENPGLYCYVTDGRGGSQGDYDVDHGKTTLMSPLLNLESFGEVSLRYHRWYTNDTGHAPGEDFWIVEVSDDAGEDWIALENTNVSERFWKSMEFDLGSFIEMTDEVLIRFVASDTGSASIVEAAIDDVEVILTGVLDTPEVPRTLGDLTLVSCRPNPSGASTVIDLYLGSADNVRLSVYDLQGRVVRRLIEGPMPPGSRLVVWDGTDGRGAKVPSGVYFCRLEGRSHNQVRRLVRID